MLAALHAHLRLDGVRVALAYLVRWSARTLVPAWLRTAVRGTDPGEAAAARYLRATGHRVLARNWRSPRDARDEADLVVVTPDRETVVLVEVKRAAGDWDPLERVDGRKRAVLWRLVGDLARLAESHGDEERVRQPRAATGAFHARGEPSGHATASPPPFRWSDRRLLRPLRSARAIRTDLIAVRGSGASATVLRHLTALHEVRLRTGGPESLPAMPLPPRAIPRAPP